MMPNRHRRWRSAALLLLAFVPLAHAATIRLPDYERHVLPNGTVLLLAEKHDVPIVALDVSVRGGSLADPEGKAGTAALLAELMQKGADGRTAAQFAEAIDAVGGRLSIDAGRTALGLSAEFLAADAALMVELAADALRRPTLAQDEFDKVRDRAIKSLVAAKDGNPQALIGQYGASWLYRDHPYGRPTGGSEQTLATVTHGDVTGFHRDHAGGDRLIVTAVGDFETDRMKRLLSDAFGDWPAAAGTLPTVEPKPREQGRRVLLVDKPGATQTYFWLGNVGSTVDDPQRVAQDLVNTLFGGRFTSMLNSELRIRTGLTYGARSGITRLPQPGPVSISSFTRTDATVEALDLALATLDKLHQQDLDEAQLQSGRNYVLGQFPPTLETSPQLAGEIGTLELFGLGRDEIDRYAERVQAVDAAAAKQATAVFPPADDLVMVLIGDASKIREQVAKYGPVTEMKIDEPRFAPAGD